MRDGSFPTVGGSLVEMGTAEGVFRQPMHRYTRGLLNSVPDLRTARNKPLQTIEDTVPPVGSALPGSTFAPGRVIAAGVS